MMVDKVLRTEIGERVEQRDFQYAVDESLRASSRQLVDELAVGRDSDQSTQPRNFVVSGFATSNPSGTVVQVDSGVAILGVREKGVANYGALISGGDASRSQDISSYADDTYYVYVKFELRDADFENRNFWNAAAATPVEYTKNIATRREANWSMVISSTSPGPEYVLVASIVKSGASLTPADLRHFYFEGDANASFNPNNDWGTANDRDAARATKGVFGFFRFIRAVQVQLKGIIGPFTWYRAIDGTAAGGSGPRSLHHLNDEKLGRDGSQTMQGDILPSANNTYDLGAFLQAWDTVRGQDIICDDVSATNDYSWASARQFKHIVPAILASWPRAVSSSDVDFSNAGTVNRINVFNTLAAETNISFPVELPDGATLTTAILQVDYGALTDVWGITAYRQHLSSGSVVTLRSAGELLSGTGPGGLTNVSVTFDQNNVIDLLNYRYWIKVRVEPGFTMDFYSLKLLFTHTYVEL